MGKKKKEKKTEKILKSEEAVKLKKKNKSDKPDKQDITAKAEKKRRQDPELKAEKKRKKAEKKLLRQMETEAVDTSDTSTVGMQMELSELMGLHSEEPDEDRQQESGKKKADAPVRERAADRRRKSTAGTASETEMADVMKAFGDPNRMQILDLLKDGELCAADLLKSVNIVQSTLSHHMKSLVDSGVVRCRKQGKWSYYSLDQERIAQVSEYLLKWC